MFRNSVMHLGFQKQLKNIKKYFKTNLKSIQHNPKSIQNPSKLHPESIQIHQGCLPTSIFGNGHEKGQPWVQQWSPPVLQDGHFW